MSPHLSDAIRIGRPARAYGIRRRSDACLTHAAWHSRQNRVLCTQSVHVAHRQTTDSRSGVVALPPRVRRRRRRTDSRVVVAWGYPGTGHAAVVAVRASVSAHAQYGPTLVVHNHTCTAILAASVAYVICELEAFSRSVPEHNWLYFCALRSGMDVLSAHRNVCCQYSFSQPCGNSGGPLFGVKAIQYAVRVRLACNTYR